MSSGRWRMAALGIGICAAAMAGAPNGHASVRPSAADPAWTQLTAGMETMHAAMASIAPTGDTDADFVRLMLPHHQAAIDMARAELLHGTDPQMRRLAQEILIDQQSEIELMRHWLKRREGASPPRGRAPGAPEPEQP